MNLKPFAIALVVAGLAACSPQSEQQAAEAGDAIENAAVETGEAAQAATQAAAEDVGQAAEIVADATEEAIDDTAQAMDDAVTTDKEEAEGEH